MEKLLVAFLTALFSVNASANLITIDFENVTGSLALSHQTTDYTEDGVTMSVDAGHYDLWGPSFSDPTANRILNLDNESGVVNSFPTSQVRFDMGGASFDLVDMMVVYAGNQLNQLISSSGGVYDITSSGLLTLTGSQWQNITWFTLSVTGSGPGSAQGYENTGFDNIRLAYMVPAPGTLPLILLGLGVFMWMKMRRPGIKQTAQTTAHN